MTMTLHSLKPASGSRSKSFRIGRGNASGRGTTAGKGTKGQRARSGGRNKLKLKGLKQMLLSFPKKRGFRSRYQKAETLTLARIEKAYNAGDRVDIASLKKKSMIPAIATSVKIVGTGELKKALKFHNVLATASAKIAIEKAGGSVSTTA